MLVSYQYLVDSWIHFFEKSLESGAVSPWEPGKQAILTTGSEEKRVVIAFIFNGRKRDNLHEVIRFKFHIQERLRFHSLKGNKNRHDIMKKSPTPPPTHQTFSPPHTLFQTRGLFSGPHLTEITDRQCCLLFGKGARLVDAEPQSWWGRAHIPLRAQSHLPGRVTREVCSQWEVLEGFSGRGAGVRCCRAISRPPWWEGWTPQPLLLHFHRHSIDHSDPQNNGVSSGAHSLRVTYSSFEATVELLWVL